MYTHLFFNIIEYTLKVFNILEFRFRVGKKYNQVLMRGKNTEEKFRIWSSICLKNVHECS
jgi:hypothetical protein